MAMVFVLATAIIWRILLHRLHGSLQQLASPGGLVRSAFRDSWRESAFQERGPPPLGQLHSVCCKVVLSVERSSSNCQPPLNWLCPPMKQVHIPIAARFVTTRFAAERWRP